MIELLLLVIILILFLTVRVSVVIWTLVLAGLAYMGYTFYIDPSKIKEIIPIFLVIAFYAGLFYLARYLFRKIKLKFSKIKNDKKV